LRKNIQWLVREHILGCAPRQVNERDFWVTALAQHGKQEIKEAG